MTDSPFETLRQELRAMRGDFDQRFDSVGQRFDGVSHRFDGMSQRFDRVETRLTKLEVQLDSKPDKAFFVQTLLIMNVTFLALIGLSLLISRSFLIPA